MIKRSTLQKHYICLRDKDEETIVSQGEASAFYIENQTQLLELK